MDNLTKLGYNATIRIGSVLGTNQKKNERNNKKTAQSEKMAKKFDKF
jgi:hypothetical protein